MRPFCVGWYRLRYTLTACACAKLTECTHWYGSRTLSPSSQWLRSLHRPVKAAFRAGYGHRSC